PVLPNLPPRLSAHLTAWGGGPQGRPGEAQARPRLGGHRFEVALYEGAQHRRIDAALPGHVDGKLRAGAAILGHDGDDTRRAVGDRRHAFAIPADRLQLTEGQQRTRIDIDHLVHIAGVIVPSSLEGGNLPPQKPSQHGSAPFSSLGHRSQSAATQLSSSIAPLPLSSYGETR